MTERTVIVGGGMAGLVSALVLAAHEVPVLLLEKEARLGGKMREVTAGGQRFDAGPTVLTMRWVFDELFASIGQSLDARLSLTPLRILARHAWPGGESLDLHADIAETAEAIARFAGRDEAARYREFCAHARRIFDTLDRPFLRAPRPTVAGLVWRVRPWRIRRLWDITPFDTLWSALGRHFRDPRLRQLFGRYATYCGSSPFDAPGTLMLIAHAEQQGVWSVGGGMQRLAEVLAETARALGAELRTGIAATEIDVDAAATVRGVRTADGDYLPCRALVFNGDYQALSAGLLGAGARSSVPVPAPGRRSLSAITWHGMAHAGGMAPVRHNVLFSPDYRREFAQLSSGHLPDEPTVYLCAQDRLDDKAAAPATERLMLLVNAPAIGERPLTASEVEQCERRTLRVLQQCGLQLSTSLSAMVRTTPSDFARLFPATGGALYGAATHGWQASFRRPGTRTPIRNLYLAGGSVHPGPGVPMAALSGRLAAQTLLADFASMRRSYPAATAGGISMR
jgi:1-hydroxycarotenoid 3,4-desaturase